MYWTAQVLLLVMSSRSYPGFFSVSSPCAPASRAHVPPLCLSARRFTACLLVGLALALPHSLTGVGDRIRAAIGRISAPPYSLFPPPYPSSSIRAFLSLRALSLPAVLRIPSGIPGLPTLPSPSLPLLLPDAPNALREP